MIFQRERITDTWAEASPLFAAHHLEAGLLTSDEFSPSLARFASLETLNMAYCYTGRDNGKLVAYAVFFLIPHLHYSKTLFAQQDVMYVSPEYRGIGGVRFIQYIDEQLAGENAGAIIRHSSIMCDHSRTLERLGYQPTEVSFVRRLA